MRTILTVALLCALAVPHEAHAQAEPLLRLANGLINTECSAVGRDPLLPVPPAPLFPPGLPKQLKGTVCGEALVTGNWKGGAVGWWCPRVTPDRAGLAMYAVTWESLTLPMLIDFGMLLLPGVDSAAKLQSMQTKYQSLDVRDMCDIWGPLAPRLNAIYPAPLPLPPPPGTWKTVGGTIFKHANGRLTGITSKTVAAGNVCAGETVATSGARVFQAFTGAMPGEAAECTRP